MRKGKYDALNRWFRADENKKSIEGRGFRKISENTYAASSPEYGLEIYVQKTDDGRWRAWLVVRVPGDIYGIDEYPAFVEAFGKNEMDALARLADMFDGMVGKEETTAR